ncbi:alpha/beta fold hydrolase [Salinarimonas sp.]|uniref:alpha/beta hydrolase family protein n=1 Tax=Salinarimonas sp. TaxID=2766526 RepID=UPI0032D997C0
MSAAPQEARAAFDFLVKGERAGRSLAAISTQASDTVLTSWLELFANATLAQRGYRRCSRTTLDPDGRPVAFVCADSLGNAFALTQAEIGAVDLVLEPNMVGALALWVEPRLARADEGVSLDAFACDPAVTFPIRFRRDARGWSCSTGDTLLCGAQGRIETLITRIQEMRFERVRFGRRPAWDVERLGAAEVRGEPQRTAPRPAVGAGAVERRDGVLDAGGEKRLDCTLALPRERPPFARALFLGGSGMHDRHGRSGDLLIGYDVLLDGLAAHGLASLRFDRYGGLETPQSVDALGFDAVVADACAALDALHGQTTQAPTLLVGHSFGGLLALAVAARRADVDAIALIATPGRPVSEVVRQQLDGVAGHMALSSVSRRRLAADQDTMRRILLGEDTTPEERESAAGLLLRKRRLTADMLALNPAELVAASAQPLLLVHPTSDFQVFEADIEALRTTAAARGRPTTLLRLEGHNHLLRLAGGAGYGEFARYFDRRRRIPNRTIVRIARALQELACR